VSHELRALLEAQLLTLRKIFADAMQVGSGAATTRSICCKTLHGATRSAQLAAAAYEEAPRTGEYHREQNTLLISSSILYMRKRRTHHHFCCINRCCWSTGVALLHVLFAAEYLPQQTKLQRCLPDMEILTAR
jgi:hypothetical protein